MVKQIPCLYSHLAEYLKEKCKCNGGTIKFSDILYFLSRYRIKKSFYMQVLFELESFGLIKELGRSGSHEITLIEWNALIVMNT